MSKYEELSTIAAKHSEEFYKIRDKCTQVALYQMEVLRKYFEAPSDSLLFAELDKDLRATGKTSPFDPMLINKPVGEWYFGLHLHLELNELSTFANVTLVICIKYTENKIIVKFEKDFNIIMGEEESFIPFCEYVFASLKEDYSKPIGMPKPRIGF